MQHSIHQSVGASPRPWALICIMVAGFVLGAVFLAGVDDHNAKAETTPTTRELIHRATESDFPVKTYYGYIKGKASSAKSLERYEKILKQEFAIYPQSF